MDALANLERRPEKMTVTQTSPAPPASRSLRSMSEVRSNVKVRSSFKQKAFEMGKFNRVILPKRLPGSLGKGEVVEIAMMGILGRVSSFYSTFYKEEMNVKFDYWDDITKKVDVEINGVCVDLKSRFTHNRNNPAEITTPGVKIVTVFYDYPGISNLLSVLREINLVRPIPNQLIKDINYIWELYMSFSVIRDEEIYYKHFMNEQLDDITIYTEEFPELSEFSDLRTIAYMYTEEPVESSVCAVEESPGVDLEAEKRRAEQIKALKVLLKQKNITAENIFNKFRFEPYKSLQIPDEKTLFSLLKEIFPEISHKLDLYTFSTHSKGGDFKISYEALHMIVSESFPTAEHMNENISTEWVENRIYPGFLKEHFRGSLFNFVKFINPDVSRLEIFNLPLEEHRDADKKEMLDILLNDLGLNSVVIKLLSPSSIRTGAFGNTLTNIYGEMELYELVQKRLRELNR